MKKYLLNIAALSMIFISIISCRDGGDREENEVQTTNQLEQSQQNAQDEKELEDTQLVPTGTYTGIAMIVDSDEREIYVRVNDTTTIELYFSDETQLMRNNQQVEFDALQEGQTVEVEVERSGESLTPKRVRIVEEQH